MKLLKTKTVRFSQIVEECGQPNVYTLWEKAGRRSAFSTTAKEQSGDDNPKERERDGLWNHWRQREERCALSCFPKIVKTVCGQARHRDRLDACSRVAALARWPGQRAFAKKM